MCYFPRIATLTHIHDLQHKAHNWLSDIITIFPQNCIIIIITHVKHCVLISIISMRTFCKHIYRIPVYFGCCENICKQSLAKRFCLSIQVTTQTHTHAYTHVFGMPWWKTSSYRGPLRWVGKGRTHKTQPKSNQQSLTKNDRFGFGFWFYYNVAHSQHMITSLRPHCPCDDDLFRRTYTHTHIL